MYCAGQAEGPAVLQGSVAAQLPMAQARARYSGTRRSGGYARDGVLRLLPQTPRRQSQGPSCCYNRYEEGHLAGPPRCAGNPVEAMPNIMLLVQVMLLMPVGSVDCERTFLVMNLIKNDQRNKLKAAHLNCCVMVKRCRWDISNFPFRAAYHVWYAAKGRRG